MREIKNAHWEFTHHLLQCVTMAPRPLRVEELAEVLAFDFKAGPIPRFHGGWRLEDPVDAVLSTCSSLLAIVNVEDFPVIQFSHFPVRECLTSRIVCLPRANRILRSVSGYTNPLRKRKAVAMPGKPFALCRSLGLAHRFRVPNHRGHRDKRKPSAYSLSSARM